MSVRILPRRGHGRGFTLVELLVAIAVLAIVAVLGWRGLDGILRSRQTLTASMEQTRGLQLAFAQMQSDCEHLAPDAMLHNRASLLAENDRLTLVRTVLAENEPSRLQVVSYRVRDGVLTRRESTATRDLQQLDALWQAARSDSDPAPAVTMQSGVAGLTMRLWQNDSWRSTTTGAAQQSSQQAAQAVTSPLALPTGPTGLEVALQLQGQEIALIKIFLLGAV
ncbi:MAG: type II secretion system protein J [Sphingomonadaceae bacterium]